MTATDYVFLGIEVPPWLRITFGVLAVVMGGWFLYAAAQRARSDDPAIRVEGPIVLFHVNPGRRIELRREEIRGIGPVRDVAQAVQRAVLGSHVFEGPAPRGYARPRYSSAAASSRRTWPPSGTGSPRPSGSPPPSGDVAEGSACRLTAGS